MLLLLAPGIAAGQAPIVPPSPPAPAPIVIDPRTPPPATIPSAPEPVIPIPPPETPRPTKTFDFRPSVSVSEQYTDNFNQTPTDKVSNFRTAVTPELFVLVDLGSLTGQAAYAPMIFYDTSLDKADVNQAFRGQLAWQAMPRLKLSASDIFTQSDEPSQADRLGLRTGRQQFESNLLSLTGDYVFDLYTVQGYYRLSTFWSDEVTVTQTPGASASITFLKINRLTLGYEYLDSRTTSGPPGTDSTTTGNQVTGTVSRDVSKDLAAGVTAVYAVREEQTATGNTNFTRWGASLFMNYIVPDRLVIQGNIGVAQLEGESSSRGPLLTTDSSISYHLGSAVLGLKLERGFSETFGGGENFGVVETSSVSGSLAYKFTPSLSGLITGGYRENQFTGEGGGQAGQKDKIISASANITYQILRWLSATLDYTYTNLTSSDPGSSYVENRARAALNVSFY